MTSASRPDPATDPDPVWRVVVNMPLFGDGKRAGQPVGWHSLNNLPASTAEKILYSKAKKQWRLATYAALQSARVPKHLGRIAVDIELRFPEQRDDRNSENFGLSIKPVIDALGKTEIKRTTYRGKPRLVVNVGWEVVESDAPRFMVQSHPTIGEPLGRNSKVRGQIILTIRQLPQENQ